MEWSQKIFKKHGRKDFEDLTHAIFQYQIKHCSVYSDFVNALGRTYPSSVEEIPFLPISFFKSKKITSDELLNKAGMTFKSSGTQGKRSQHFVKDISIYESSFNTSFEFFIGKPASFVILGLLPNYLEQGDSSLIHMVSHLIEQSASKLSRFILGSTAEIPRIIDDAKSEGRQVLLFGVSYSLMDLMDLDIDLS